MYDLLKVANNISINDLKASLSKISLQKNDIIRSNLNNLKDKSSFKNDIKETFDERNDVFHQAHRSGNVGF